MTDFSDRLSRLSDAQLRVLAGQLVEPENVRTHLVAYVVVDESVQDQQLRDHCKQQLPDYMLPQRFETVETLPLTATGKVDYRKLQTAEQSSPAGRPDPDVAGADSKAESTDAASYDTLVTQLTEVWCDVLQMDRIFPEDDYFELGGDSISNLQIIARCAKFDIHLSPADILQNSTIELLARSLERKAPTPAELSAAPSPDAADVELDLKTKSEMLRVLNLGREN